MQVETKPTVEVPPSKSQALKAVRRVYPGAFFCGYTDGTGVRHLALRYLIPNSRTVSDVGDVTLPSGGRESMLPYVLARAAFARLGFSARWHLDGIPPDLRADPRISIVGRWSFSPIEGYVGPENQIPVELDPNEALPDPRIGQNEIDLTKLADRE